MNILPKKRWHVRTKDNIARVRKDEAAAREEEDKRKKQLEIAESEARINFLRQQCGIPVCHASAEADEKEKPQSSGSNNQLEHVDLFADYKSHIKTTNKELEKEKKEEQEKYEKQIGYLTYLGQDTNEALKLRSWYEVAPKRRHKDTTEINEKELKIKQNHDPLTLMKALLPAEKNADTKVTIKFVKETSSIASTIQEESIDEEKVERKHHKKDKKHKHKKHSRKHSSKKKKKLLKECVEDERKKQKTQLLERLRQERLRREAIERARQEAILKPKETLCEQDNAKIQKSMNNDGTSRVKQKYNSQFNPDIAKQNM